MVIKALIKIVLNLQTLPLDTGKSLFIAVSKAFDQLPVQRAECLPSTDPNP